MFEGLFSEGTQIALYGPGCLELPEDLSGLGPVEPAEKKRPVHLNIFQAINRASGVNPAEAPADSES